MTQTDPPQFSLSRRLSAEWLGTAFLLATVVGSGIMGDRLSGGIPSLALLANAIATGAILIVLILILGPVSGAHFNPAVTISFAIRKDISWPNAAYYCIAQTVSALVGVVLAHLMFAEPLIQISTMVRGGGRPRQSPPSGW